MKPNDPPTDAEFERLVQQAVALRSAPAAMIQSALALFPARTPVQQAVDAARAWAQAVLSFDSWSGAPHAAGVRGLPSDSRQLVFTAQGRDIDLRIVPSAGRFLLSGQVLGPDDAGQVELQHEAAAAEAGAPAPRTASLDTLGGFRLDAVPPGRYRLTLMLAGDRVQLPAIDVGARQP